MSETKTQNFILKKFNKGNILSTFDKIYGFFDVPDYQLKGINNDEKLLLYHYQSNNDLFEGMD